VISDLIVLTSVLLTIAFVAVWLVSPRLRAWIERPKHHFHDAVKEYDREQRQHVRRKPLP
jgi:hypothetical protein